MNKKKQTKKILQTKKNPSKNTGKSTGKTTKKSNAQKKKLVSFNSFLLIIIALSILLFTLTNVFNIMTSKTEKNNDDIEIIFDKNKKNTDAEIIPIQEQNTTDSVQDENAGSETGSGSETETDSDPNIENSLSQDDETPEKSEEDTAEKTQKITLYFIKIKADETPVLVKEERLIARTPAILTHTIDALLQGTRNTDASSYIPKDSALQTASVSQGIATLDFNEHFQYNDFGTAGILAQLYQIVYTCTEIAGINAVQITIDNEKIEFLGGEGNIQINTPLTRAYLESF